MAKRQGSVALPATLTVGDYEYECVVDVSFEREDDGGVVVHAIRVDELEVDPSNLAPLANEIGLLF